MRNKWGLVSYFMHNEEYFFKELQQIKALGFDGAEIIDPRKFTLSDSEIRKGFKDSGLSLLQMHSDYSNMADPDAEKRRKAVDWYKSRVEYALKLEAEELLFHVGGQNMFFMTDEEMKEAARRNIECLRNIVKETRGTGLKISLENGGGVEVKGRYLREILRSVKGTPLETRIKEKGVESEFRFGTKPDHLVEVVKAVREDYPNVGICLDIRNAFDDGVDLGRAILEAREYIISVHMHEGHSMLPGRGLVRWDQVMRAFKKIGYEGVFIIEVSGWQEQVEAMLNNVAIIMNSNLLDAQKAKNLLEGFFGSED